MYQVKRILFGADGARTSVDNKLRVYISFTKLKSIPGAIASHATRSHRRDMIERFLDTQQLHTHIYTHIHT